MNDLDPHDASAATDELRALDVFTGRWHAEGTSYGDDGTSAPWISKETYSWQPGGFFLLHRWFENGGGKPFIGSEILGFDKQRGYFSEMFDNAGNHPSYRITLDGNVWTFEEDATRATATIRDGNTIEWHWEWKRGGEWKTLCDRVAKRA